MKFKEFGWNGFYFVIPEEMRFTREGGSAKSGNFRLETDDYFLEIKWETVISKTPKSLQVIADDFVKQIKKSKKQSVKVLKKDNAHVFKHDALHLGLKSAFQESIYLWNCDESKRVVICNFAFKTIDDTSRRIMKQILDTFRCHSEKNNVWSTLELRFEVPTSFLIIDRKMMLGRAYFSFKEQKLSTFTEKTRNVFVEYFSMANLTFEDTYKNLGEWFQKHYLKDFKKRFGRVKFENEETKKFKKHNLNIKQGKKETGLFTRKTSLFTNATWYCSNSNRIYSVTISSYIARPIASKQKIDKETYQNLIEETLSSFKCH